MKEFIQTLKNIFKIEELRSRVLLTLGLILIYRLGSFVVLPGIDPDKLGKLSEQTQDGLLGLINMFSGGAFANASIFALGIMPYISASIVMQLVGMAVPYFQKLQKDGESGRTKMNQITRYLTVLITAAQAPGYLANLKSQIGEAAILQSQTYFWVSSIIILVAGTMFVMWLGEKITDKGIGNGISLIIMIGIIAGFPQAVISEFSVRLGGSGSLFMFLIEMFMFLVIITLSILLIQGTRKIPIQYAKRIVGNADQVGAGARQYLPLKVNTAGVMPIIFAQAIMFVPLTVAGFAGSEGEVSWIATKFSDISGFWYNLLNAVLIIVFTYFYTAITYNPTQIADELKRNGGFIPGVKPGKNTADFIDTVMSRITFPGSLFLAVIAILPAFAMNLNVTANFAMFYGGTSMLILVGVVLDTLQQIESYLLSKRYDGLMKSGRIKGRTSGAIYNNPSI